MRFAHSFWTEPLLHSKFDNIHDSIAINLIEYALSVEYVHKHGYEIDLYTDKDGSELFKPIPYDNVYVLENTITNNYHFAASFKFMALGKMPLDSVLIDGDIFLHKPKVYSIIKQNKSDILVSMFEPKKYIAVNRDRNIKMLELIKPFEFNYPYETPDWKDCDGWYNTSLMKFNDETLKEEYIEQYKDYVDIIKNTDFEETWPDIILEQRHLTQLCRNEHYSISVLVKDFPSDKANKNAIDIGFIHLGSAKRATQQQNVQTLWNFNKELVLEINEHITNMTKYFEIKK